MSPRSVLFRVGVALLAGACSDPRANAGSIAIARGRYLVQTMGCGDCHTPHGPDGKPLAGRELSGHPADSPLPSWEPAMLQKNAVATTAPTATAFAGPFGLSVAPNLTPDATGIAQMTAAALLDSWRTGRHWQEDRAVMPPMPVSAYRLLEDADVRAIHAYLKSLPPVRNQPPKSRSATAGH